MARRDAPTHGLAALCAACGAPMVLPVGSPYPVLFDSHSAHAIGPCCWPRPVTARGLAALWAHCDHRQRTATKEDAHVSPADAA